MGCSGLICNPTEWSSYLFPDLFCIDPIYCWEISIIKGSPCLTTIHPATVQKYDGAAEQSYAIVVPLQSHDCNPGCRQPIRTYNSTHDPVILIFDLPCWLLQKINGEANRIELPLIPGDCLKKVHRDPFWGGPFSVSLFENRNQIDFIQCRAKFLCQAALHSQRCWLKESTAKVKWDFSLGFLHHRMFGARPKHPILQVPYT